MDSSLAPCLLVAMPQLLDPNFHRAIVLLVHHDEQGCFGVVVNRETDISAERLCESISIDWRGNPDEVICWGGPVQPETGWVLFGDAPALSGAEDIRTLSPRLHFAGSLDVLERSALAPPDEFRMLLGYAGWGPGQLESELAEGAWLLAPLEEELLFDVPLHEMWTRVLEQIGVEPATLVSSRGVH